MAFKKKKDLATELIDDLLADSTSHPEAMPPTASELDLNSDKTERLGESKILSQVKNKAKSMVQSTMGIGGAQVTHLGQVENLRVAQQKILDLENEISRLREENEQVVAAADALRKENESLSSQEESHRRKFDDLKESMISEKGILEDSLKAKDRQVKDLRIKVSEFDSRLSSNLQKIRIRERELENRLELMKVETSALSKSKDEMLLDLKRQVDSLNNELENFRGKTQELSRKVTDKQEMLKRTVKALRLALSMLENDSEDQAS